MRDIRLQSKNTSRMTKLRFSNRKEHCTLIETSVRCLVDSYMNLLERS